MQNRTITFIAIAAVLVTAGAVWFSSRAVTPGRASWGDILAEAKAGGYNIITSDELSEKYRDNSKSLLIVDTRQDWEYRTGHLKGAVNFPMEPTWWSRWRKTSAMETFLGPDRNRTIVFY